VNAFERRRLRAPALTAASGLILAVGVVVAAGWVAAVPVAVAAAVPAAAYYWLGGRDADVGAMVGARADERQAAVRVWVRAFAGLTLLVVAAVGAIVSAAAGRAAWPYAAIAGLGAVCLAAGLAYYRTRGRLTGGLAIELRPRLDERELAVALHALQLAGIAMFVVSAVAGAALSGRTGDTALRILALAFVVALAAGLLIFRRR